MCIFVKVFLICIIFSIKYCKTFSINTNTATRTIYRTNSAPELNKPSTSATGRSAIRHIKASASTAKNVHFRSDVARRLSEDLNEALLATNVEHLNPSRDGYHARNNRVLARYGVGAVVMSALGVGAAEIYKRTSAVLTKTTSTTTSTTEENISLIS